jgi:uncharacterized SAM-binding protein YcdF (DUF218 family)
MQGNLLRAALCAARRVAALVCLTFAAVLGIQLIVAGLHRSESDSSDVFDLVPRNDSQPIATTSAIVIPGAWRIPKAHRHAPRAPLSRAFRQRVRSGVELALKHRIPNVVFTGGRWDAIDAREWAIEAFALHRPPSSSQLNANEDIIEVTTAEAVRSGPASARAPFTLRLAIENVSTTTESNAIEAARVLDAHFPRVRDVIVVSSGYHLPRCYALFQRHLAGRSVRTIASSADEFELLFPSRWWVTAGPSRVWWYEAPWPDWALTSGQSLRATQKHWMGHFSLTVRSLFVVSWAREMGALLVHVAGGKLSASEAVSALVTTACDSRIMWSTAEHENEKE